MQFGLIQALFVKTSTGYTTKKGSDTVRLPSDIVHLSVASVTMPQAQPTEYQQKEVPTAPKTPAIHRIIVLIPNIYLLHERRS